MVWKAEDSTDLRLIGLSAFVYAAAIVLFTLVRRWRTRQPLFAPPDWRRGFLDHWFVGAILCLFPFLGIMERHGVPGWAVLGVFLAAGGAANFAALRGLDRERDAKAAAAGVVNPDAAPASPTRLSAEEVCVQLRLCGLLVLLAACAVDISLAIPWALAPVLGGDAPTGSLEANGWLLPMLVAAGGLLALLVWIFVGRWPRVLSMTSSIEIDAPPEAVWKALRYVGEAPYYKGIVRRVEPLDADGRSFLLHYYNTENCGECCLPKHPDAPGMVSQVDVLEAREPALYRVRGWLKQSNALPRNFVEHEDVCFAIERLPGDRSVVTDVSTILRPRVWAALLFKMGDPLGEQLRHLKAHVGGISSDTLWDAGAARIAAARRAPKFCGCR